MLSLFRKAAGVKAAKTTVVKTIAAEDTLSIAGKATNDTACKAKNNDKAIKRTLNVELILRKLALLRMEADTTRAMGAKYVSPIKKLATSPADTTASSGLKPSAS